MPEMFTKLHILCNHINIVKALIKMNGKNRTNILQRNRNA